MAGFALLAALIGVPIAEIAVLIEVGSVIGTAATILLIVLTAIVGTALIRHQGLGVVAEIKSGIEANAPTLLPIMDGLFLLIAGALLLTPGFITDALGFAFLIPPVRHSIAHIAWRWLIRNGHLTTQRWGSGNDHRHQGVEIEGEAVDLGTNPGPHDRNPDSPWSDPSKH